MTLIRTAFANKIEHSHLLKLSILVFQQAGQLYGTIVFLHHLNNKPSSPMGQYVLDEREHAGDIISGKLGLQSHHKRSFLRVDYEQTCQGVTPLLSLAHL
jgi:hypothetical protein